MNYYFTIINDDNQIAQIDLGENIVDPWTVLEKKHPLMWDLLDEDHVIGYTTKYRGSDFEIKTVAELKEFLNTSKAPLMRCPFCDSKDVILKVVEHHPGLDFYAVVCNRCKTKGPQSSLQDTAVYLWNHRAQDGGNAKKVKRYTVKE